MIFGQFQHLLLPRVHVVLSLYEDLFDVSFPNFLPSSNSNVVVASFVFSCVSIDNQLTLVAISYMYACAGSIFQCEAQ